MDQSHILGLRHWKIIYNRLSAVLAFSSENPTGSRNGGTRGKDCEKLNASTKVMPGETLTLVDADGPGMMTNIWIGGDILIRCFWHRHVLIIVIGICPSINIAELLWKIVATNT